MAHRLECLSHDRFIRSGPLIPRLFVCHRVSDRRGGDGIGDSGSRLLAPVFGNSLYVWGALIGVILASMSSGYALGGGWRIAIMAGRCWPGCY